MRVDTEAGASIFYCKFENNTSGFDISFAKYHIIPATNEHLNSNEIQNQIEKCFIKNFRMRQ